jgi:hypothetical protein
MLGVTFFGIFLTPVFYFVLQSLSEWWSPHVHAPHHRGAGGHAPIASATHPAAGAAPPAV